MSVRKCLDILGHCHLLESCDLTFGAGLNDVEVGPRLQLGYLSSFALNLNYPGTVDAFVSRLGTPNLLRLSLYTTAGHIGSIEPFRIMLGGSRAPLEDLKIESSRVPFHTIDDFWKFWEFTPNLKKLVILGSTATDPFGGEVKTFLSKLKMNPDSPSGAYLPQLEELLLQADFSPADPPPEDLIRGMLQSRLGGFSLNTSGAKARLNKVGLTFWAARGYHVWFLSESGEIQARQLGEM
ncbi:hypothetical protein NEOLEDRAFT_1183105 [Neolentinus lepideus HHB14362 ss-1]|uniref:Uncharacterized protein n=1 Tax=Neolentinus lepideus HHB14362 ss-1 TaxID=1314782 RepID=A0A165NLA5_9AGAM|nr:hypothetical protein NEOLEDRAFT_1183105 [Neolentinus lepideus HHB14362 ss-1]